MGQRVNLQYTVDIDELPKETSRLILKAHQLSKDCSCILSELSDDTDILTMDNLECVEKARLTLMNIDYALQDIQNIIRGYIAHKSGINEEPQQDVPHASLYEPGEIDLDNLESHINNFKQAFEQSAEINNDIAKE